MISAEQVLTLGGLVLIAAPLALLTAHFVFLLFGWQPGEKLSALLTRMQIGVALVALFVVSAGMLWAGKPQHVIELGDWVVTPAYHLKFGFVLDLLSLSYAALTMVLCAVIAGFSTRYMHREPGYARFFVLFTLFQLGMVTAALSDTVETLFAGWELVGLSSVLLIAFFQERPAPPRNGLRVWIIYRVGDAALMLAAVLMHEINGAGDFDHLTGDQAWPAHDPLLVGPHFVWLGVLFVIAAACKSGLVPFSGWLPRAMEGPTPSSAVFYGALSVHLGAFLLLRVSPVLDSSPWLSAGVVVLGLATALVAWLSGRVQADIKSALALASLTQVGLIIAEIGLGFRYLPLIHLLGHACLRTLQFLRAPSLLHDHHQLENAIGARPRDEKNDWADRLSPGTQGWLYRFSMERGYLDTLTDRIVTRPVLGLFRLLERLEQAWARLVFGRVDDTGTGASRGELRE